MTKVHIVNNTQEKSGVTHSTGDFYLSQSGNIYILAVVDYNKVCLIGTNGTRWNYPEEVESISNITLNEFQGISSGGHFTKIESLTITVD